MFFVLFSYILKWEVFKSAKLKCEKGYRQNLTFATNHDSTSRPSTASQKIEILIKLYLTKVLEEINKAISLTFLCKLSCLKIVEQIYWEIYSSFSNPFFSSVLETFGEHAYGEIVVTLYFTLYNIYIWTGRLVSFLSDQVDFF